MNLSQTIVVVLWLLFWSYWAISSRGVKKVAYKPKSYWRYWGVIPMLVIFLILVSLQPTFDIASLTHNIVAMIIGIIILVIGLAFAVWARVHIGRNWSSEPSIQEGHELVTSGPYRFVRHPIYTGISCALLGTALVGGPVWLIIFIPVLIMFISRIHLEEKFMEETFPNEYPEYKKHTKALIPLIW